jgi:hypothetical protein
MAALSHDTFVSDDMVISYVLGQTHVTKKKIDNRYYNMAAVRQFRYGFEEDALHKLAEAELATEGSAPNPPAPAPRGLGKLKAKVQQKLGHGSGPNQATAASEPAHATHYRHSVAEMNFALGHVPAPGEVP